MFGIIIFFSHYLMNNNQINENDQIFENNSLFSLNENEKCSQNPSKDFSNKIMNKNLFDLSNNCLNIINDIYIKKYLKINLIIRFLNQSNNHYLLEKFLFRIKNEKKLNNCISSKRINILIWENLSEENKLDNSILFDENNSLNIIIDIDQLSSKLFIYDIIVQMPQINKFKDKLEIKIDHSFLEKHQHPSEQIVFLDLFQIKYFFFVFYLGYV